MIFLFYNYQLKYLLIIFINYYMNKIKVVKIFEYYKPLLNIERGL